MTVPPPLGLRPAGPADAEFLYRVYASTRHEELAPLGWPPAQVKAFLRMQFRAQDTHYRTYNPAAAFDVILSNGEPAGRNPRGGHLAAAGVPRPRRRVGAVSGAVR